MPWIRDRREFLTTLQTELLDRGTWRTRGKLQTATSEYIEAFYNRHRRHSALGYLIGGSL